MAATGRRTLRPARPLAIMLTLAVTALLVVIPARPVLAKPTIPEVEAQIAAANNKLEPIIEAYNRVHSQLVANQTKAKTLQKKLTPLQLSVTTALGQLGPLATKMYEAGPTTTLGLLMGNGSTADLLTQMALTDQIARTKKQRIATLLASRDKYAAAKSTLDKVLASLSLQNADLAAKANTIQVQVAALQKLRQQIYGTTGAVGRLRPVACPFTYIAGAAGIAAKTACAQIGKPYVWAAEGPGSFDCSGLTLFAWAKAGVTLRHYTVDQWHEGTPVSRSQLRTGDLVFFYPGSLHHMGLYVGGGWMVHAPQTGDYVRMARIDSFPIAGFRRP